MRSFKDTQGRSWELAVNALALKRVKGVLGIELLKLLDGKMEGLIELLGDVLRVVEVLYVLCKDECEKRGLSDEDFLRAMAGDEIEQAGTALVDELIDFFPNPRVRANLKRVMQVSRSVGEKVQGRQLKKQDAAMDSLDEEQLADQVEKDWLSKPGNSSGGAPGSAA